MNHLPTDGLPADYLTDWTDGRATDGWAWGEVGLYAGQVNGWLDCGWVSE